MSYYLRLGITCIFMFFTGLSIAAENNKADLSFQTIPDISHISTYACVTPVLATYTIISGTPVPLTLEEIKIDNHDAFPDEVVTIVPSASNSCKKNQTLANNETCNITISLQPCDTGKLNRTLIIDINTTQGLLSTTIASSVSNLLQVAAGNGSGQSPLLIQSQDNGLTWQDISSSPILPNPITLSTATCNLGATCIVAGQDQTPNNPPLLITTRDSGNDWTRVTRVYNNNQLVALPETGRFEGSSCSSNNCIAVGVDLTDDAPLLINSINAGATWYQRSIPNVSQAELFGGSCNHNLCVVTGTTGNNIPLLTSSTDGGVTWSNIAISFPTGAMFTQGAPSCGNKLCIAGGAIIVFNPFPQPPNPPIPYLISSASQGTWTQVNVANSVEGNFNSFSCSASNCVAVGSKTSGKTLIAYTTDNGNNWNLVDESTLPSGGLNTVSCFDNHCVAGGYGPLLLSSQDGGGSWKQITTASGDGGFPNYGDIEQTGCTNNICMAGGGDITHSTYLLTSLDGGKTWKNVSSTIGEGLPTDALINTVSISR
ncbi:MAG: hypothetical protein ABSF18_00300 [Gammaproteobacteria bacterium]|jgi:photosystem II stability/assembly factor-like uncharacterized protein